MISKGMIILLTMIRPYHYLDTKYINISLSLVVHDFSSSTLHWLQATGFIIVHTEKTFWNLINSNQNQILFTIFRLIWNQTDVRLDPN